jgi:hypothetical protein
MAEKEKQSYKITTTLLVLVIILTGVWFYSNLTGKEANEKTKEKSTPVGTTDLEMTQIPTEYDADVTINFEEKSLSGVLNIKATNYTGKIQDKLYYHLYPNQFKDPAVLTENFWRFIIDENSKPGWIDITGVKVNGQESEYEINETILGIPISGWENDEVVNLEITFDMQVPKNNGRFAYDDHAMWLGNWLPIQAVYEEEKGWITDPYHSLGDPFYSEVGKYHVKVNVPVDHVVATSGKEEKMVSEPNGTLSYETSIESVRDFTMVVMDKNYQKLTDQSGNTTVNTWFLNTDDKAAVQQNHDAGLKALSYFNEQYGEYAYPEYDIVPTGMFTAMEYPGMIFLPKSTFADSEQTEIVSVVHETAHQWWYGMVGNNQVSEPWLDEALTTYATTKFFLDEYPEIGQSQLEIRKQMLLHVATFENKGEFIGNSIDQFSSVGTYSPLVYQKGALMFEELEKVVGKEEIDKAFRKYFNDYKFKNAKGSDLIKVFSETIGPEAKEYFEGWLKGKEPEFKQS